MNLGQIEQDVDRWLEGIDHITVIENKIAEMEIELPRWSDEIERKVQDIDAEKSLYIRDFYFLKRLKEKYGEIKKAAL